MDLLTDVLTLSGVRGTLGARIEAPENWGVTWSEIPGAAFYALTAGTAWLKLPDRPPVQLLPGDVMLLPTGASHTLSSAKEGVAVPQCDGSVANKARAEGGVLHLGEGATRTYLVGANYRYDATISTQVFPLLPELVHIRNENGATCLDDTVRLLARELAQREIATDVVLNSLIDILLVQVLRVWLDTHPQQSQGTWLGVLGDSLVTESMLKLHEHPARSWTTTSLAAEVAVSRATLLRRFAAATGQTPGAHLTRWRMDLAAVRLRDSDDSIDAIAHSVGYTSVYAFTRAFSRTHTLPPGQFRTRTRTRLTEAADARC